MAAESPATWHRVCMYGVCNKSVWGSYVTALYPSSCWSLQNHPREFGPLRVPQRAWERWGFDTIYFRYPFTSQHRVSKNSLWDIVTSSRPHFWPLSLDLPPQGTQLFFQSSLTKFKPQLCHLFSCVALSNLMHLSVLWFHHLKMRMITVPPS